MFSVTSPALKDQLSFIERLQTFRASQNIRIAPIPRSGGHKSLESLHLDLKPIHGHISLFEHCVYFDAYFAIVQIVDENLGNKSAPQCVSVGINVGNILPS